MQLSFFDIGQKSKKHNVVIHSESKSDKTIQYIKTWNIIKHIYRYQTLYKICEKLFLLTYNNQLACLNYYIDEEKDDNSIYTVMYAEIEDTHSLPIKDRILKHIKLLRDIKNGVELEHDIKKVDSDCATLFG